MGLDEISEFNPSEKIIEYVMEERGKKRLVDLTIKGFMEETASESPAPGGGSVSSYIGAVGMALGTMVANLSSHKRGWDDRWEEFSVWAEKGKEIQNALLRLVDEDTASFNRILEAMGLPKKSDEEKAARHAAIQEATRYATLVPFKVMETAFSGFEIIKAMVEKGNPNSITDAGVGALSLRTCIRGAFLNVQINAAGIDDKEFVSDLMGKGRKINEESLLIENEIISLLESRMSI
jgi:glutamate formiminotransferase/formiminotetrahydrofolate cyclodeaminase